MATHLDLEEQEQLDQLKHFWNTYGTLITWVADAGGRRLRWPGTAGSTGSATQAAQASALYDEVERGAQAGDTARVERALADMKDKFAGTAYAQQAGLLAAKALYEKGNADASRAALAWVAEQGDRRGLPGRRPAAPGRRAAGGQVLRRGAQAALGQRAQGIRGPGGRPQGRHLHGRRASATRPRPSTSKAWTAFDAAHRLPPPGRDQAQRASASIPRAWPRPAPHLRAKTTP